MKKTAILLVSLLLLWGLFSCGTIKKDVTLSQDRASVQAVEIYHPEHAYYEGDVHALRQENEPIADLDAQEIPAFMDLVLTLRFEEGFVLLPIPMDGGCDYDGYVIAVVYTDGGYDLFAEGGQYSYAVGYDGRWWHRYDHSDYCGEVAWAELVEKYIEND